MLAYILGFSQTAFQKWKSMDFPGGPVVKTLSFQCRGTGSIPRLITVKGYVTSESSPVAERTFRNKRVFYVASSSFLCAGSPLSSTLETLGLRRCFGT